MINRQENILIKLDFALHNLGINNAIQRNIPGERIRGSGNSEKWHSGRWKFGEMTFLGSMCTPCKAVKAVNLKK